MNKYLITLVFIVIFTRSNTKKEQISSIKILPYYEEATFTPRWFETDQDLPANFHQIPSFTLQNQLGKTITEQDVDGKIYVVDFFFTTCPGICPRMTDNMAIVQKEFLNDDRVLLLSHSVTPEFDSVATLQVYAEANGIVSDRWHLLTGERKEIYDLGRNHYFVEEDLGLAKDLNDFIHTENFVLIDQNRHIRGIYNGLNKTAIAQLIADINTLKTKI